jgi:hypothetical protein
MALGWDEEETQVETSPVSRELTQGAHVGDKLPLLEFPRSFSMENRGSQLCPYHYGFYFSTILLYPTFSPCTGDKSQHRGPVMETSAHPSPSMPTSPRVYFHN